MRQLWSAEAEQSVLGALLLDDRAMDAVADAGLVAGHFFDQRHGAIFDAMQGLVSGGQPLDVVTVAERLESAQRLGHAGGADYLSHLAMAVPHVGHAVEYAAMLVRYATERRWLAAAQDVIQALTVDDHEDHDARISAVQQRLTDADQQPDDGGGVVGMAAALGRVIDNVERRAALGDRIDGLCTGFRHVDYRLQGMQGGELIIVAGRPGMGKTAYVLNLVRNAVLDGGSNVFVFSLEMPTAQLVQRMVAAQGKIKLGLLKSGKVLALDDQLSRFGQAVTSLKTRGDGHLWFEDRAGLTINQLGAIARRQHRREGLSAVVVDHIGLVESTVRTEMETVKLSQISRGLKKLAKDLGVPVIALSQVNRDCEKRANKRPQLSDLRMSGALEQDADVIQMLYRDEYYNDNTQYPGMIEVNSAKLRDGEPGVDYLSFQGSYQLMTGIEPPSDDSQSSAQDSGVGIC